MTLAKTKQEEEDVVSREEYEQLRKTVSEMSKMVGYLKRQHEQLQLELYELKRANENDEAAEEFNMFSDASIDIA